VVTAFVLLFVLTGMPLGASDRAVADPAAAEGAVATLVGLTPVVKPDRTRALVTLTRVAPTVVGPGTDVTVSGVVTAPLGGSLTAPTVQVRLGASDVTTRTALDDWASGRTTSSGRRVGETTLPDVAAGSEASFTIVVPAAELRTPQAFAVLPISVEVVQQGASRPVGMTRTFLAWNSRKEFEPIQVATLMPVTLDPVVALFSQEEQVRDAAWAKVIGPGSRVTRLVEGTKGSRVTVAVDPAVFGPAVDVAAPSTSAGPDPVVSQLADQLAAALRERPVIALPYADADVGASGAINPTDASVRALVGRSSLVAEKLREAARGDIAWPADGLLPNGRESQLKTIWAGSTVKKLAGLVVDQRAITADSPYTPSARRVAAGGTRLLGYDSRLSAQLPKRSDPTPVLSTQRYLAESLVLLGERAGTPRSTLVVAPRTYDTDPAALAAFLEATSSVPWLQPVDATSLLTDRASERAVAQQRPAQAPPSAAPGPTLTTARLAQMTTQRATILSVSEVLANGAVVAATYGELLDELTSTRWRWNRAGWTTLSTSVSSDITAATRAIRVVPRSVNLLAEHGTLQVTVVNGLADVVEDIRLKLVPNNPRIQIVEQPGPITIQPGSRAIVPVEVAAVAAGKVEINAYLTTADGTVIGTPAAIRVQANPLDSTIYWAGGMLVAIVLLAGIARTILRGTSRIDEIEDIEAVTAAHAAGDDMDPR